MASKTQEMAVRVLTQKGQIEGAVRCALWSSVEGGDYVYLDNAKGLCEKYGMTAHQFAGGLSALQAKGEYKQEDGFFGRMIRREIKED